jgi:hypothetical protein
LIADYRYVHKSVSPKQTLRPDSLATCSDFVAVVGFGLQCQVSGIEPLMEKYQEENRWKTSSSSPNRTKSQNVPESPPVLESLPRLGSPSVLESPSVLGSPSVLESLPHLETQNELCCPVESSPTLLRKTTQTYSVLIGNRDWMRQNGMEVGEDMDEKMIEQENSGRTAVLVAIDGRLSVVCISNAR